MLSQFVACIPKKLPDHLQVSAAQKAIEINPYNAPTSLVERAAMQLAESMGATFAPAPSMLAVLTNKYWGVKGVTLTVGFMEQTTKEFRDRVLSHANAWNKFANVKAVWTQNVNDAKVRITLMGDGYWSYLGTDILNIPRNEPTMCLERFSTSMPESEWKRVVRHEFGHTWGFPHEHMLPDIVSRLDPNKTIAWAQQRLGWDARTTRQQILTPLAEDSVRRTSRADQNSIMCYQLPGEITRDGQPIVGGADIDHLDAEFAASIYPLADVPVPPKPPVNPPVTGGAKMTKTDLLNYLTKGAATLSGLVTLFKSLPSWLSGLIPSWVVTPVTSLSAFLTFLASDPALDVLGVKINLLDLVLSALNSAGFSLSVNDMPTALQLEHFQQHNLQEKVQALPKLP